MAFTDTETAEHTTLIEELFWSRRRPPLHLRDQVREGQRFAGHTIELFLVRPAFERPGELIEESIGKVQFVRSRNVWRLFWMRADLKWHRYPECPEVSSLEEALRVIDEDADCCFFG